MDKKNKENKEKYPLVSIIVPVYNVQHYLAKCLGSLVHQTYPNIEIIIVDDGSKDESAAVYSRFAQVDSRIIIVKQKNAGVAAARINGFQHSSGDFITFVDGDDYVSPNLVSAMIEQEIKTQADIISCRYYEDFNGKITEVPGRIPAGCYNRQQIIHLLKSCFIYDPRIKIAGVTGYLWTRLFKRNLVQPILQAGKGLVHSEDQAGILKAFYLADSMVEMERPLYYYVQRKNQATRKYKASLWENFDSYFERLKAIDIQNYLSGQIPNRAFMMLKMLVKMEFENPDASFCQQLAIVKMRFSMTKLYAMSWGADKNFNLKDKEKWQYELLMHKHFVVYGILIRCADILKYLIKKY